MRTWFRIDGAHVREVGMVPHVARYEIARTRVGWTLRLRGRQLHVFGTLKEAKTWADALIAGASAAEYTLDGEPIDLQEFIDANPRDDNPEVDPDDIRALKPGGVIFYGGGAAPTTILRRVR